LAPQPETALPMGLTARARSVAVGAATRPRSPEPGADVCPSSAPGVACWRGVDVVLCDSPVAGVDRTGH
jgi:hypothetical protein